MGDGVSHLHLHGRLDARNDISHIPGTDLSGGVQLQFQVADFFRLVLVPGGEELHLVPGLYAAVHHLEVSDDAAELVENGVEDKGLERCGRVSLGRRNPVHDCVKHRLHALPGTGRYPQNLLRFAAQKVAHLVLHQLRLGGVHVNLVEHRNNLQTVVYGLVQVGNCLRLNALGGVHNQQCALTGRYGT